MCNLFVTLMCRYSTPCLMCPSPMPSYTCPGRKAVTPSLHPAVRGPWRSSMLCRPQKNVSLCCSGPGWYVETSLLPPWLAVDILLCVAAFGVQKILSVSCWERKAQVSGQEAKLPLSAAQQELGSGIAGGPSFVGRSHRNSSLPLTRFGIIIGGSHVS